MLAKIEKQNQFYVATYERHFDTTVEEVWSWLTENEKLTQWFSELIVYDLRKGGVIAFNMGDGSFEKMRITDFKDSAILEFTWGDENVTKDSVRFELTPHENGCELFLIEKISEITDHTPRDLAGWHICLDVIERLMEGKSVDNRMAEWEKVYPKYIETVKSALDK